MHANLDENWQRVEVLAVPLVEWGQKLQTVALGVHNHAQLAAVFRRRLMSNIA